MARDTGSYTTSSLPVTDPLHTLPVSAASANNTTTLSYTTTGAHNLYVGAPVIIYGTGNVGLNWNPDTQQYGGTTPTATLLGWGTPATVAAVTGTNTFTVKAPSVVATASVSTGTVVNDALVSNSGWDQAWLPTTSQTNVVIAREWGNAFPIQPNDDRAAVVAITGVSADGAQVTMTVGSGHGLVAGQTVTIQGIVPTSYNFDTVQIAATSSTTIVFNSAVTDTVASYTNGAIVSQLSFGGSKQALISAGTGATQQAGVTPTPSVAAATGATSITVATTSVVVGASVSGTGIAAGTVVTAVGTGTITINPATSGTVSSSAALTIGGTRNITYQTKYPHNLSSGQIINVTGSSNASYNVVGKPVTVVNTKTFSVPATAITITAISTATSSVTITTDVAHGVTTSDYINVAGVTGGTVTAINVTSTQPSAVTSTTITYAASTPALTGATALGTVVKSSGAFSGTAFAGGADNSWSSTYNYPSGQLNPALDNHDRVTNSDSGYPAFTPSYTTPNLIGLTTTNAIQKLRAAGQTPGFVQFSTDLTVSAAAASGSDWVYTTGTTNHNLAIGDTVNLSGGTSGAVANNLGDVIVGAVSGYTFTIKGVTGTTTVTNLVARPKNTVVSAQSPSAGATTATVVGFTRNYGI
jgi:hypothetical protein